MSLQGLYLLLLLTIATPGTDTLDVYISHFPPLVNASGQTISGFEIDLWEEIAAKRGYNFRYNTVEFNDLLSHVEQGDADIGLGGITINAEREAVLDFGQHFFDSGLNIAVRNTGSLSLLDKLASIFSPGVMKVIFYFIGFILLCGHVLWWTEKGDETIKDRYFPGIFEAYWLVLTTMTTVGYGDFAPRKWLGRFAALLIMISGIALFGWTISEFAAAATVQKIRTNITSPADLSGKKVATVAATTSVNSIRDHRGSVVTQPAIEDCLHLLENGEVDAVVYDAPVLMNLLNSGSFQSLSLVGALFDQQYYGFAFPQGGNLREEVNRSLLGMRDKTNGSSRYNEIYEHWFGKAH